MKCRERETQKKNSQNETIEEKVGVKQQRSDLSVMLF